MQMIAARLAREWLTEAVRVSNLTPTEIARRARLSPSALTRPLSPKHEGQMRASTLQKVSAVTAHPLPPSLGGSAPRDQAYAADPVELAVILAEIIPTGRVISGEEKADLIRKTIGLMRARHLIR